MKTLNTRWRLIALVPLVAVAILSVGNRIGAVRGQIREVREAANEGGIWIAGGITLGQILRFNVVRLANHPGGMNLQLRVFDSQGTLHFTHVFPDNPNGGDVNSSFFDVNSSEVPPGLFENNTWHRAQLIGIFTSTIPGPHNTIVPGPPCGFGASGEIFNSGNNGQTLVHIAGTPISECR